MTKAFAPISVIVPAYNAAATLVATLEGVRAQTLSVSEIIVVDDGSTDGTAEIATACGARVERQPNAGVASARNRGLALAKEPWVAFLDADDVWVPTKIERQWNAHLLRPSAALIATDFTLVRQGKRLAGYGMQRHPAFRRLRRQALAPGVWLADPTSMRERLASGCFLMMSSILIARDAAYPKYPFDESLRPSAEAYIGEDWDWYLRLLREVDVLLVTERLVDYRLQAISLSSNPARLRRGDLIVSDIAVREPDRYPPEIVNTLRRIRPILYERAALTLARQLDFSDASTVLSRALAECPTFRTRCFALAVRCANPPFARFIVRHARNLWRGRKRVRRHISNA